MAAHPTLARAAANQWTNQNWTTDGNPPVCHVYYNAHGALWQDDGLPPPQTGTYGMKLDVFSTIGDKCIESVSGVINDMKGHPEFKNKGIDSCFPSMLRRVTRNVARATNGNPDEIFNAITEEAREM